MPVPLRGLIAVCVLFATAANADPVRVFAAGSLNASVTEFIAAAKLESAPEFGPSGLLMQRIASGEKADLMMPADTGGPQRMAREGRTLMDMIPFARNRMCVFAPRTLGLTTATLLDRLLSPQLRLATSTPGADPGGDYAVAVFDLAERLRPGAGPTLSAKAMHLVGGPDSAAPMPGHSATGAIFAAERADALLAYCSGSAALLREMPNLVAVPVPNELEPQPVYGMAVITANPEALRFALFVLSERGQAILAKNGLLPVLAARPEVFATFRPRKHGVVALRV